jgi:large subunit ribosomal protein L9
VGDVCEVAPGYGRNFLLPQGLAILATAGALKQVEDLKRIEHRRQDRIRYDMERLAQRIGALDLSFTAHVGETGRLYGSITATDIAEAIEAEMGEEVDRRKILLDESIRTLGEHEVPIHLMPGVDAQVSVTVVASDELVEDIGLTAEEGTEPATPDEEAAARTDGPAALEAGPGAAPPEPAAAVPDSGGGGNEPPSGGTEGPEQ